MLVSEAHQAMVTSRLTGLPLIVAIVVEVAASKRLARYTSQGVCLLYEPPKYPGTTFGRLVEQDRAIHAEADTLRAEFCLLELEQLLAAAL